MPAVGPFVQISFYRAAGHEPFGRRESRLRQSLAPHLSRMARLRRGLDSTSTVGPWTAELAEGLAWGIILLDAGRRPLLVNREATRILATAASIGTSWKGRARP